MTSSDDYLLCKRVFLLKNRQSLQTVINKRTLDGKNLNKILQVYSTYKELHIYLLFTSELAVN